MVKAPAAGDLGQQTISGLSWQVLANVVRFGGHFAISVVLARLLPPEDFGIVGIAYIATSFAYVLTDAGLREALIQRKTINERHIRVCYTVSTLLGLLLTIGVYQSADLVAGFFQDERVGAVLKVLSVSSVLTGFAVTGAGLMVRRFAFKKLVTIEVIASVLGYGVIAIVLAASGFGYWSLVAGTLVQAAIVAVLTYASERHSLRPLIASRELSRMLGFSAKISAASVTNFFALKGDQFMIGRMMDAASLGFYTRAYTVMQLPQSFIGLALSRVLFPAASRVQDEPQRFRRAYLATLSISVTISLPICPGFVILAPEIILTLFGEVWAPTIPLLQILGLFGMLRMTYNTAAAFVKAYGRADHLLVSTIVYAVLVVVGSWWAARTGGLQGVAWAVGCAIAVMWILMVHFANQAAGVSLGSCARVLADAAVPPAAVSLVLLGLVLALRGVGLSGPVILLGCGGLFGLLVAAVLLRQLRRLDYPAVNKVVNEIDRQLSALRYRLRAAQ
jgi:O-antigen/teichoic acid export membrane protein